ncbi:membrane protein insertion efficiency factor YidD [Catenulispora acidiphila]|nr:membrane protein insertion efficiency factor YidD [Catenulispora acidiphila]
MDDEIGTGEILDEDTARRDRRRWSSDRCLDDTCDLECLSSGTCCESAGFLDGNCLLGLTTLTGTIGGLLAALAGTGPVGRRLRTEPRVPPGPLAAALHRGVRYYQVRISARRPGYGGCRYAPTCSAYAAEALRRHGALKGTRLAARRLRRCRPGTAGGLDPVP